MKNISAAYHKHSAEEFRKMWEDCIFAFDTNVLLNIYRYTKETQSSFFQVLEGLKERIWIPHQVAIEFFDNRDDVIRQQAGVYAKIDDLIDKLHQQFEAELKKYEGHISINVAQILESIQQSITTAKQSLSDDKQKHPDYSLLDPPKNKIIELFDGRVGDEFSNEKLLEIHLDAETRFKLKTPPGYEDAKKSIPEKYGDVVIWFQLIEFAKVKQKPLIFVTNDKKEDWWLKEQGKTIAPRTELLREMHNEAGVVFHMYQINQFIKYAQDFLTINDEQSAIREIEIIEKQDEELAELDSLSEHERAIEVIGNLVGVNANERLREAIENASGLKAAKQTLKTLENFNGLNLQERILNDFGNLIPLNIQAQILNDFVRSAVLSIDKQTLKTIRDLNEFGNERISKIVQRAGLLNIDNQMIENLANLGVIDPYSQLRKNFEATVMPFKSPLSGQSFSRGLSVDISPKHSTDLQDGENLTTIKVEVLLNDERDSLSDEVDDVEEQSEIHPYEFNGFPSIVLITHKSNISEAFETSHRLRKPSTEEWDKWISGIECHRRYLSPAEIDEHNAQKDDDENEELATEIYYPFYDEDDANEVLYGNLILETAGIKLHKDDTLSKNEFRKVTPELAEKVPILWKNKVVSKLYECWCSSDKDNLPTNDEQKITQQLVFGSKCFNVIHILRKPTEVESHHFRTNILKGYFAANEESEEVVQLKLNNSIVVEFYDRLIIKIENATVNGKHFSDEMKNAFLESINPVYKLRVLEPLFNINAWYFDVDKIFVEGVKFFV